jgi:hypothetical protein
MEKIPSGPSISLGSRRARVVAQFFGASSMYRFGGPVGQQSKQFVEVLPGLDLVQAARGEDGEDRGRGVRTWRELLDPGAAREPLRRRAQVVEERERFVRRASNVDRVLEADAHRAPI